MNSLGQCCALERGHLLCSVEAEPENKPKVLQKHLLLEVCCRNHVNMKTWRPYKHLKKLALLFWQISMTYLMSLFFNTQQYVLNRLVFAWPSDLKNVSNEDLKNPEFPTLQPAIVAQQGPSYACFSSSDATLHSIFPMCPPVKSFLEAGSLRCGMKLQ